MLSLVSCLTSLLPNVSRFLSHVSCQNLFNFYRKTCDANKIQNTYDGTRAQKLPITSAGNILDVDTVRNLLHKFGVPDELEEFVKQQTLTMFLIFLKLWYDPIFENLGSGFRGLLDPDLVA